MNRFINERINRWMTVKFASKRTDTHFVRIRSYRQMTIPQKTEPVKWQDKTESDK